jgi:prepilin-type N-terminal cleavage/methylation domain-containing protein
MKNKLSGFTLIEILIVLAIIGIATALASPIYFRYIYTQELVKDQQTLVGELNFARNNAKKNSQNYFVEWVNLPVGTYGGGTLDIVRDQNKNNIFDPLQDTKKTITLGKNIGFFANQGDGGPLITFLRYSSPYGRLTTPINATFTITHANLPGQSYKVRVMGVTGKVVRVEKF